jgi:hypothetical protein
MLNSALEENLQRVLDVHNVRGKVLRDRKGVVGTAAEGFWAAWRVMTRGSVVRSYAHAAIESAQHVQGPKGKARGSATNFAIKS